MKIRKQKFWENHFVPSKLRDWNFCDKKALKQKWLFKVI